MSEKQFYIVDVFAEDKYQGNQLAVFRNASDISESEMQLIAQETHFSETTFIHSDEQAGDGYDVRIFTPAREVPFAGHPTLGTAYIIHKEIENGESERINLNLKVGRIPVTVDRSDPDRPLLWMKQNTPEFGKIFKKKKIAASLNLDESDIAEDFPVEEVSTGLPFIIAPLNSLEAVKKARVDIPKFFDLVEHSEAKAILVFCPETYRDANDLNVRVFVDYYNIPEDPATGSGNGCLAGWLVKHQYFGDDSINVRVEQGYEIGRPSLLLLKAEDQAGEIMVYVGGRVVPIAQGTFL
jgi:trans-2,3-dihydro-3-hydroxyanthranilate isomerase